MTTVRIEVVIDPRQAQTGAKKVREEIERTKSAADRLRSSIRGAFAGIGAALIVRELVQAADAYTNLQNRLRTVTRDQEELADVTEKLFSISNDTRSAFDATAEVYARTAASAKDLGVTQNQVLAFTKGLNQAVALSGATAQEARAGMIQLSQGMASGRLSGEELKSVLEQLPAVADVIAKHLGVTRGELRELGKEGELTPRVILDAFDAASKDLDDRFAKTIPTIGQSFVVLQNELVKSAGEFQGVASATSEFVVLGSQAIRVTGILGRAFGELIDADVPGFLHKVNLGLSKYFDEIDQRAAPSQTAFNKTFETIQKLQAGLDAARDRRGALVEAGELVPPGLDASIASLQKRIDELTGSQKKLVQSRKEARVAAASLSDDDVLEGVREEARLLGFTSRAREVEIDLLREVARIEKEHKGLKVSEDQKALIRAGLEANQVLNDQVEALEKVTQAQSNFEIQARALSTNLADGSITQKQFNDQIAAMVGTLEGVDLSSLNLDGIDFSGLTGGGLQEFIAKLRELKNVRDTLTFDDVKLALEQENALLGLNSQERAHQIELLRQLGELRDAVQGPLPADQEAEVDALLRKNEQLTLQAELLDGINGPQQQFLATQAALNELLATGAINAQQYAIALGNAKLSVDGLGRTAGEGLAAGLQQIENQLVDVGGTVQTVLVDGFNEATDVLATYIREGGSFKDAMHGLIESILDDLAKLLVQQAILGIFGGPAAAQGSGFFGLFGGGKAAGGPVGPNKSFLVGEEGPELFTPPGAGNITPARETASRMAPTVNVTTAPPIVNIMNVSDPREVPAGIATPEGEEAVLNVIRKNPQVVRRS